MRHLVKGVVVPAYRRHLDEVKELGKTDPERAARHLLSFAVVDPACGSAHFLVQVTERLAEETVRFLARHPLPGIVEAMERLRAAASPGVEIDDLALLRRLLVKHCVFGVDKSAMGAEVATLSLWLASFVPGLSLSWLGRNVRAGDSLIGVADPASVVPRGSLFTEAFEKRMKEATDLVRAALAIDDATPEEVEASRKADLEAARATEGLKRLFDLWTAEQFGLDGARQHGDLHGIEGIRRTDEQGKKLVRRAAQLAKWHDFLHWPLVFPQVFHRERPGFDVVVGNPPWEEVTIEELSFYGMYRPGVAARPYGMEIDVVDDADEETRTYARRVEQGDASILDEADEGGGLAFSGEALRAEVRPELEEGRSEELKNLPWGIGAAFRQGSASPSRGAPGCSSHVARAGSVTGAT